MWNALLNGISIGNSRITHIAGNGLRFTQHPDKLFTIVSVDAEKKEYHVAEK